MSEEMGVKESISFWKQAFQGMPTVKDAMSATGENFRNWGRGISDRVEDGITHFRNEYDDSIFVPAGTTTVLGRDFSTLYESASVSQAESTSGTAMNELVSESGYETEMLSANLNSTSGRRSIATLQPSQRAAYEIVLLSKKYASMYSEGADANNEAVADAYTDDMVAYRQACEAQGMNWQSVMQYASWELQTQSLEYTEDAKGLYNPAESERNRVLSNRAHSMMLQCAPDGWQDTFLPHLSGRITYEETLDTDERSVGFLKNVWSKFCDKFEKVKEFVTTPWRKLKELAGIVPAAIDTADVIVDAEIQAHERNKAAYDQALDEAKTKAGEFGQDVKDRAGELYDQAQEYFGNISGAVEGETPSPER